MSNNVDFQALSDGVRKAIAVLETQAENPNLPKRLRNRSAAQARRFRKIAKQYPQLYDLPEKEA